MSVCVCVCVCVCASFFSSVPAVEEIISKNPSRDFRTFAKCFSGNKLEQKTKKDGRFKRAAAALLSLELKMALLCSSFVSFRSLLCVYLTSPGEAGW